MESKSKSATLIIIIVIVFLMAGYLWYLTIPRNAPPSKVVIVPADLLDNDQAKEIKKSPIFGNVPVTVSAQEKGRPDPFANL